jgi:signal peptidase I
MDSSPVAVSTAAPIPFEQCPAPETNGSMAIAEHVRSRGSVCLNVLGGSMFPWIRPRDLLFVRRWNFDSVAPGDVVLFEQQGRFFIHRVLRRVDTNPVGGRVSVLITKGDALDGEDPPVSAEQFLGRVIRIQRHRRHVDLRSRRQELLGRVLAWVSRGSPLLYVPLRTTRRIFST